MIPIGPKPVLQYVIESLAVKGFDEIVVTTNYLEEQIENYFGDGSRFGVKIRYPREDKPLGTAGSVKNAEHFLDETFALIQGDNITDIDIAQQLEHHKRKNALATLGVIRVEEPWKYGVVKLTSEDRIAGFQEKPSPQQCHSNLINTGLYIFEPAVLDLIPRNKQVDFSKEVFPRLLEEGKALYGYRATGFWTDVGSVEGYLEASAWILSKLSRSISQTAEIRGKVKGPVWIGDETVLEKGVTIQGPVYIEDSCRIRKDTSVGPNTILKKSVTVGEQSRLNGPSVFGFSEIHSRVKLGNCILDEHCEIGSGTRIEKFAIIGAGCRIGNGAFIGPGVKLELGTKVEKEKVIKT
jgi:NDP-sugar pyrophosphorylase family protein